MPHPHSLLLLTTLVTYTLGEATSADGVTTDIGGAAAVDDFPLPTPAIAESGWLAACALAFATLTMGMAVLAIIYHRQLLSVGLRLINSIIAGVLDSPQLSEAIVGLVARILQHPKTDAAISRVVSAVLKNEGTRHEISQVVVAVLGDGAVRSSIGEVVSEVLSDGELDRRISGTVRNVLSNECTAEGIVGAFKGTSLNMLSEASAELAQRLPTSGVLGAAVSLTRRRLGHNPNATSDAASGGSGGTEPTSSAAVVALQQ